MTYWIMLHKRTELIFTTWNLIYKTRCIKTAWQYIHFHMFFWSMSELKLYITWKSAALIPDPTYCWVIISKFHLLLSWACGRKTHEIIVSQPNLQFKSLKILLYFSSTYMFLKINIFTIQIYKFFNFFFICSHLLFIFSCPP